MELDKITRNTKADMPSTSSANKPVTQTSITAAFNASAKAVWETTARGSRRGG